jgi:hypothetical protein
VICDPLWFSPTTSRQSKSLKLQHHLGFSAGYPQCFHTIFSMWKTAKKPSISIDHFPKGFPMGFQHLYTLQGGAPRSIAKLVNITPIIMVYRWYSYIYSWAYNQFITGVGTTSHASELLCQTVGDQIDHLIVSNCSPLFHGKKTWDFGYYSPLPLFHLAKIPCLDLSPLRVAQNRALFNQGSSGLSRCKISSVPRILKSPRCPDP